MEIATLAALAASLPNLSITDRAEMDRHIETEVEKHEWD
jgi:hypothetical protein